MQLPDRPNLRHLRDQARDLVRSGAVSTLADAQLHVARQYGFASWPKLKQHVESLNDAGRLRQAIASNDVARVESLLTSKPELRQVLIDDVPLQAQAQPGRTPMMELLVRHGADVNGLCWGWFPVLFTPCENLEPEPLEWLLDHGADPNRGNPRDPGTALDYVIQTYPRHPKRLGACIELLIAAGGHTRYDVPGVLAMLRGRIGELAALLDADSALLQRRYPELDCGPSSGNISLQGATLLHVAAEYGFLDASRLLLDRGADVNARADVDVNGVGGQTAIFHALAHFTGVNPEITQLLIDRGADLTIRARVTGHGEHSGTILDVSATEYAATLPTRFPL
ncbi:MAG TPA: ankyrin repeat domain-containing protein [Vicinamibacterales bacterium]|nr:ankyrin repeat domain-containing protein [Vicinamibacterales bacterium]